MTGAELVEFMARAACEEAGLKPNDPAPNGIPCPAWRWFVTREIQAAARAVLPMIRPELRQVSGASQVPATALDD